MAQDTVPAPIVATRRITGPEVVTGEVAMHPDLEAVELIPATALALAGGGQVIVDHDRPDDSCVLAGAPGWVGRAAAGGDLLSFGWDGETLTVAPLDGEVDEAASGRMAAALVAASEASDGGVVYLTDALRAAAEAEPDALAGVLRSLSELLSEAGLEYHHGWIGQPGTDWATLDAEQLRQNELAMLAAGYGLTKGGFDALQTLLAALETARSGADDPVAAEMLASALAEDDGVAPAFLSAALGPSGVVAGGSKLDEVEELARRARPAGRGRQRGATLWVLASCAERRQDWHKQDAFLGEAVAADPGYGPALQDASWTASDRGQAGRAASLLASGGLPADDPWRQRLEHFAHPGPNQGGRNDPCKCGSGRKAKSCCMAANGWPIESRLSWLYDKAISFLNRPTQRPALTDVLDAWIEAAGTEPAATRRRLVEDPLPEDLALFEGGVLARFAEARASLLPADESATVASWVGQPLRVCEVLEVRPDEGVALEDLLTGERLEVTDAAASKSLVEHLLVCVRVLPDGRNGRQLFGGVRMVPFGRQDGLLDLLRSHPDATAIAVWWGEASRPPSLTNRDGEPTILGRSVFAPPAGVTAEQLTQRLAGVLKGSQGELVLIDHAGDDEGPGHGRPSERGVVGGWARVVDDRLVLEANSTSHLETLTEVVQRAVPDLVLLDSAVVPVDPGLVERWAANAQHGTGAGEKAEPADPAEAKALAKLLAEQLRAYEDAWVDESIPALGGATPRQAAADPARRRDLERLLAEMSLATGGMDAGRIRSLLGLTGG